MIWSVLPSSCDKPAPPSLSSLYPNRHSACTSCTGSNPTSSLFLDAIFCPPPFTPFGALIPSLPAHFLALPVLRMMKPNHKVDSCPLGTESYLSLTLWTRHSPWSPETPIPEFSSALLREAFLPCCLPIPALRARLTQQAPGPAQSRRDAHPPSTIAAVLGQVGSLASAHTARAEGRNTCRLKQTDAWKQGKSHGKGDGTTESVELFIGVKMHKSEENDVGVMCKKEIVSQAWWYVTVIPAFWKAESGGSQV